jgi:hypothetical protein
MLEGQKNMRRKRGEGGLWAPLPNGIGSCDYAQEVSSGLLEQAVQHHKELCESFLRWWRRQPKCISAILV